MYFKILSIKRAITALNQSGLWSTCWEKRRSVVKWNPNLLTKHVYHCITEVMQYIFFEFTWMPLCVAGSWQIALRLQETSGAAALGGLHPRWNHHLRAPHSGAGRRPSRHHERRGVCHGESERAGTQVWSTDHEMTATFPPAPSDDLLVSASEVSIAARNVWNLSRSIKKKKMMETPGIQKSLFNMAVTRFQNLQSRNVFRKRAKNFYTSRDLWTSFLWGNMASWWTSLWRFAFVFHSTRSRCSIRPRAESHDINLQEN